MWNAGAPEPVSFDDRAVGSASRGGGGGMGGGGMGGGGGGSMGGGGGGMGGGMMSQQPTSAPPVKVKRQMIADQMYQRLSADSGHKAAKKTTRAPGGGPPKRPNFLVCYLCGQQFGKASLPIHQPQCYVKKLVIWERSDPDTRGMKPTHPSDAVACQKDTTRMSNSQVDEYNEQQFQQFNDNMVSCENCGRTFFPDRLIIHKRSCNPDASGRGSKPVNRSTATSFRPSTSHGNESSSPDPSSQPESFNDRPRTASPRPLRRAHSPPASAGLVPCPQCNKKYVPRKLDAHMAVCKGPSPGMSKESQNMYENSLVPCQYVTFEVVSFLLNQLL